MKKALLTGILVSTIILSACAAPQSSQEKTTEDSTKSKTLTEQTETTDSKSKETTLVPPEVKEFRMTAKQWEFEPSTITVNKGDTVKLTITSTDVKHGIAIPDFNVEEDLNPNEETVVEFIADKTGEFSFFCQIFCGSGHKEMVGTLIVK